MLHITPRTAYLPRFAIRRKTMFSAIRRRRRRRRQLPRFEAAQYPNLRPRVPGLNDAR